MDSMAALNLASSADRTTRYAYDADNRLRYTLAPNGLLSEQVFDRSGLVTLAGTYAAPPASVGTFTVAALQVATAGLAHRATRYAYDAAGRPVFAISAAGVVSRTSYDAAGLVTATVTYTDAWTGTEGASLADLQAWAGAHGKATDHAARQYYDAAGRVVYTIDPERYVTALEYDASNNVTASRRYNDRITAPTDATTTANIASAVQSMGNARGTVTYDAASSMRWGARPARRLRTVRQRPRPPCAHSTRTTD
jgi:YD repeat-containing protein